MAETYTSNLELVKPDYDSPADIFVINSNMDKIDNAVANAGKVQSVNGQTGAVNLSASDVGALPSDGTAVNATQLNGNSADKYAMKTDLPTTASDIGALAEDAQAADSAKLGGKDPKYYIQPRNLLDNSDFRNPVNQRGQTDYTSNGYTIDRWELYSGAVGVSSLGNITTSGQMYQKIAIPTDKVYTFAIENDAGIALVTGIPANGIHSATLGNALIILATIGEYVEVVIEPSEGYNIAGAYWAALYEGSYTADTLPPYMPKGYGAELAECLRYFERLGAKTGQSDCLGNSVYVAGGAQSFICSIQYAHKRIQRPTITLFSPSGYRILIKDKTNANVIGAVSVSSFTDYTVENPFANFKVALSNAVTEDAWLLFQRADGAEYSYIDITADL